MVMIRYDLIISDYHLNQRHLRSIIKKLSINIKNHYCPKCFLIPYEKYQLIAMKSGDKKRGGSTFSKLSKFKT
jgi:hypothetical protein